MLVRSLRLAAIAIALCGFAPYALAQLLREAHALVPQSAETSWKPALADLTGDGRLDLVVCPARLLAGRGDGGLLPQALPSVLAGQGFAGLVPGDADGDGDLDLFALGRSAQGLLDRLYLNQGGGDFVDAGHLHPDGTSLQAAFGDVNGDGRADLMMARAAAGGTALYLGTASGAFVDSSGLLPQGPPATTDVHLVDVDLDGDLDALLVEFSSASASWHALLWQNTGEGLFQDASHLLPPDPEPAVGLEVGDLDGNGTLDVLVAGSPGRVWLNDGHGGFARVEIVSAPGTSKNALADLDRDGDLDLLALTSTGDAQYLNDGTGTLIPGSSLQLLHPAGAEPSWLALGDLDADGDPDAVCLYGYPTDQRVHLNDGAGRFEDVSYPTLPALDQPYRRVAAGDLDGDGDADLVLAGLAPPLRITWNVGNGDFAALEDLGLGGAQLEPFPEDLDGDGDTDLYVGRDGKNALLLNGGCGALIDATTSIPNGIPRTLALAVGDLDSDGHQDAWLGQAGRDAVLFGDGSGAFTYSTQHAPQYALELATSSVALGDLDGDGDLDAFTGDDQGRARLAINLGDGSFAKGPGLPGKQVGQAIGDLALADVDGDGDLDLVLATDPSTFLQPATNDLWINQGGLVFTQESHRLPAIADRAADLHAADFDLDGDVDLYVTGYQMVFTNLVGTDTLLLNDGSGFFDPADQDLPSSLAAAFADLDADGDPDVVGIDRAALHVLYAHAHQLSWARLPRVGEPPSLRLTGKPGERWMLMARGYPHPAACGFGVSGLRRIVAEGVLPDSGEVLIEVDELDQGSTLWQALFTGRGGRAHTGLELTRRGSY